jgi:hypothetical protein
VGLRISNANSAWIKDVSAEFFWEFLVGRQALDCTLMVARRPAFHRAFSHVALPGPLPSLLQSYTWQEAYQAALQTYFNATLEQLSTAQVREGQRFGQSCGACGAAAPA